MFLSNGTGHTGYVAEYTAPSFSGNGTTLFGGVAYQAYQVAPNAAINGNQSFALSP